MSESVPSSSPKQNRSKAGLFLHPVFLISLFILLVNDFYWKYQHANWLTGKLSDFAGLIVLPVFCRVLFWGLSKKMILLACALFFIWWKSPLSQPLIELLNRQLHWPVYRVVDYTDLAALAVLPLTAYLSPKSLRLQTAGVVCLRWGIGLVTFFSLCSTSVYRNLFQAHPASEDIYFGESFTEKRSAEAVLQTLRDKGIACRRDSVMYYPVTNQNRLYYKVERQNDSGFAWQPVSAHADSTLYVRWEGIPYYLIPEYHTEDRTFRNIRFSLSENRKKTKTTITIQMFQSNGLKGYVSWDRKTKKDYKKIFATLFSAQ